MSLRQDAVTQARAWLGTPYHHRARVMGQGVDCAQLLAAVYSAIGMPVPELGEYPTDWHLHHEQEIFARRLRTAGCVPVTLPELGDIALFRFGKTHSHAGIHAGDGHWVHAMYGAGVIETRADEAPLEGREVWYFSPFGEASQP